MMRQAIGLIRRVLVGAGWFLLLWLGSGMLIGGILGAMAGIETAPPHGTFYDGVAAGRVAGEQAGIAFRRAWGGKLFLIALIVAVVGTWRGRLPGTGRPKPTTVDLTRPPVAGVK